MLTGWDVEMLVMYYVLCIYVCICVVLYMWTPKNQPGPGVEEEEITRSGDLCLCSMFCVPDVWGVHWTKYLMSSTLILIHLSYSLIPHPSSLILIFIHNTSIHSYSPHPLKTSQEKKKKCRTQRDTPLDPHRVSFTK